MIEITSGVYDKAMVNIMTGLLGTGGIPLNTGAGTFPGVYSMLTSGQPTQSLGTCQYSGVESQLATVNGYALGGSPVSTVVPTVSTHVTGLKTGANLVYTTTGTITAEWLVEQFCASALTTAANPLLCFLDMGAPSVTTGTLTITWNTNGIFTLTVAAAS